MRSGEEQNNLFERNAYSNIRVRAFALAVTGVILFVASYFIAVATKVGQVAEQIVLDQANFSADPDLPLSAVQPVVIVLALLAITLGAYFKVGLLRAISVWLIAGISLFGAQILKIILPRFDYNSNFDPILPVENTLPSGHMSVFMTIALLGLMFVPQQLKSLMLWFSMLLLALVTWQLLDYGWHRPSDLIAAVASTVAIFGFVCLFFPSLLSYRAPDTQKRKNKNSLFFTNRILTPIATALTLGCVVMMGITAISEGKLAILIALVAILLIIYLMLLSFKSLVSITSMR